jgi:hypothetical protein
MKDQTTYLTGRGYVKNERNQLQENSAILFYAPRCGDSFKSVVHNSQKS